MPDRELAVLSRVPLFAPPPAVALEHVACSLRSVRAAPGERVVTQGDPGDRFYVILSGRVDAEIDGRLVETLGPGDFFGEIALLRDVPRTATVRAREDTELYALDREDFLCAVGAHPRAAAEADHAVAVRLGAPEGR